MFRRPAALAKLGLLAIVHSGGVLAGGPWPHQDAVRKTPPRVKGSDDEVIAQVARAPSAEGRPAGARRLGLTRPSRFHYLLSIRSN